jgi:ATP-dependent Clp protease ATP-binding subunit ClpA
MERNSIGFTKNDRADVQDSAVKDYFRPEFRNRLDAICRFQQLKKADLELVVGKFVRELNTRLAEQKISLELTDTLIEHIVKKSDEQKMGARPVRRIINQEITTPLSKKILFDRLQPGLYRADLVDGKVVFESLTNIEKFPEISQDGLVIV